HLIYRTQSFCDLDEASKSTSKSTSKSYANVNVSDTNNVSENNSENLKRHIELQADFPDSGKVIKEDEVMNHNNFLANNDGSLLDYKTFGEVSSLLCNNTKSFGKISKLRRSLKKKTASEDTPLKLTTPDYCITSKNNKTVDPCKQRPPTPRQRSIPLTKDEREAKRRSHNVLEKRRREDMRCVFDDLKETLLQGITAFVRNSKDQDKSFYVNEPILSSVSLSLKINSSQLQVLRSAAEYIKYIKVNYTKAVEMREFIKSENLLLTIRLNNLLEEKSKVSL
ncbi:hypothetical protein Zmor_004098, partial [Zophobas morio]